MLQRTNIKDVVTLATVFAALLFPERRQWIREWHYSDGSLVRFSVGVEDSDKILNTVSQAIMAADENAGLSFSQNLHAQLNGFVQGAMACRTQRLRRSVLSIRSGKF